MSCVHVVEVEWVHALSCFRRSFGGLDPSRIAVVGVGYARTRSRDHIYGERE